MGCSPPGSSVHRILQARILEWVAIPFSRVSSQPRGTTWVSCITSRRFTLWATREAQSESESRSVVSDSLWPQWLHSPWNSPGKTTGVGSLSLLQGIFPTQGSNPGLLHCRQILFQLSHKGSSIFLWAPFLGEGARIVEWVAISFSRRSSWPRDWTQVSHIAGRRFTVWATREVLCNFSLFLLLLLLSQISSCFHYILITIDICIFSI